MNIDSFVFGRPLLICIRSLKGSNLELLNGNPLVTFNSPRVTSKSCVGLADSVRSKSNLWTHKAKCLPVKPDLELHELNHKPTRMLHQSLMIKLSSQQAAFRKIVKCSDRDALVGSGLSVHLTPTERRRELHFIELISKSGVMNYNLLLIIINNRALAPNDHHRFLIADSSPIAPPDRAENTSQLSVSRLALLSTRQTSGSPVSISALLPNSKIATTGAVLS